MQMRIRNSAQLSPLNQINMVLLRGGAAFMQRPLLTYLDAQTFVGARLLKRIASLTSLTKIEASKGLATT